ncbi:hypothetical protein [Cyclobacterium sp.]|uniref:hypothetical protein n=1 Tax=Cyclobacterium sp. TaxID=1966343 RepID=UPI001989143C|nr:hypothetical protein [Cyclobacterium sp.]MBD3627012.1 hypothetical protein [Cyclobacterium sp.]
MSTKEQPMEKKNLVPQLGIFLKKDTAYLILAGSFALLTVVTIISACKFGSYLLPDTIGYFKITIGFSDALASLSPFYPFLLSNFPLSLIPLFDRVLFLSLITSVLAIYLLYRIATHADRNEGVIFFSFGISLFSWWSFRVLGSAHADSVFYLMVLVWLYNFIWPEKEDNHYFPAMAVLSALMIWVKLNALFLIPLLLIWMLIDRNWGWSIVIGSMIASWALFQWVVPENILQFHLTEQVAGKQGLLTHLALFYENLASWMQVTLGLVISDTLSQLIPKPVTFIMGLGWTFFLTAYLLMNKNKRENKTYQLLLFGVVYTLCFLAFQQWSGYREVNYRTLFPYLLVISWATWITLIRLNQKKIMILLAICISGHTMVGHGLLWQRKDVSSLTLAKEFHQSEVRKNIEGVLEEGHLEIRTDAPEKLMLSFVDLQVLPIQPGNQFKEGKNYPLSQEEKLREREQALESLLSGKAVIVLFKADEFWEQVAESADVASIVDDRVMILSLSYLP